MMGRFYNIEYPFRKKWLFAQSVDWIDFGELAVRGTKGLKGPVTVKIVQGNIPGDFLWNGSFLLIVSPKVLDIWEKYQKFETYPVHLVDNPSNVEYIGVTFLGRGGPFDPVRSKAVYFQSSEPNRKPALISCDGTYFDESQWDGSDLFTIDDFPCVPIVTEQVMKEMKKAKVTNCRYVPLDERGH